MALINGVLNGKFANYRSTLQDIHTQWPFKGHFHIYGLYLIFSAVPGVIYEETLTDSMSIIEDIFRATGRFLTATLIDALILVDAHDGYKYIGYVFLKDGVKFEIKGHDQWRK